MSGMRGKNVMSVMGEPPERRTASPLKAAPAIRKLVPRNHEIAYWDGVKAILMALLRRG